MGFVESALTASSRPGKRLKLSISQDAVAQVVDSALAAQSPGLIKAATDYAELKSKAYVDKEVGAVKPRIAALESKPAPTLDVTKAYVDAEIAALKVATTAQTTQALATVSNRPPKPVSLPAVGMGGFRDFTAKSGSIDWNHNAADDENFMLIITAVTVPAAVSTSQAWNNNVIYGGVNMPLLDRVLTTPENVGGTDKTHGFIEVYGAWITSTGKVEVNVAAANSARYTLRGTSLSFRGVRGPKGFAKNGAATPRVVKFNSGATSNRVIVAAFSPTTPSTLTVKRTSGVEAGSVYIDNPMVETSVTNPARPTTKLSAPSMAFRIFEEEGLAGGHTFTSTTSSNVISGTTGDGFSSAMIGVELEAW